MPRRALLCLCPSGSQGTDELATRQEEAASYDLKLETVANRLQMPRGEHGAPRFDLILLGACVWDRHMAPGKAS